MRTATPRRDICTEIADQLATMLEQGQAPWRRPWSVGSGMPSNASTGAPYRGINVLILFWAQSMRGYSDSRWLTFKQAQAMGGSVRKGEKGTRVVFWKPVERKGKADDGEETRGRGVFARAFTLFNVEQCEGLQLEAPEAGPAQLEATAEALVANFLATGPSLEFGGDRACYSPSLDRIRMPPLGAFESTDGYYATLFHELGHSTGHASRLGRDMSGLFGDHAYSREELVAELTSAFLCAQAGIASDATLENAAAYMRGWASKLRAEPEILMWAASRAQKAVDCIVSAPALACAA